METPQHEYWNADVGETWAHESDALDAMLDPLGRTGLNALNVQQGECVLDIGCGAGATTRQIVAMGARAVGVDISAPLLAKAKGQSNDALKYILADCSVDALPGPFDAAYSRFGVMFFPDPVAAFAHIRTAMRPGGRLAFVCWGPLSQNTWATEPMLAVAHFMEKAPEPMDPNVPGPFAFSQPERATSILTQAGWRDARAVAWTGPYTIAETPEAAAALLVKIGPLSRILREQPKLLPHVQDALLNQFKRRERQTPVQFTASTWIVTAHA